MSIKSNVRELILAGITFIAIVAAFGVAVFRTERNPDRQQAFKLVCIDLANDIRLSLAASSEAQNSAVMATDVNDSKEFSESARKSLEAVEQSRAKLALLLEKHADPNQQRLLKDFSDRFVAFRSVDRKLLNLANQKSNHQAFTIASGPMLDITKQIDESLVALISECGPPTSTDGNAGQLLANEIRIRVLRIQVLVMPHILELDESRMSEFEAQIANEDSQVRERIATLKTMAIPNSTELLDKIQRYYLNYTEQRNRTLELSRQNTNILSALMATQEKRKALIDCEDALSALEKAIRDEPIQSTIPSGRNQY